MEHLIERAARKIVKWCMKNQIEKSEEQEEVLTYGYVLLLENLYKLFILILVAIITKTLWQTIVILGSFMLLRNFAGGMHCKSSLGCTLSMIGVWLIGLCVSKIDIPNIALFIMSLVVFWTVFRYAPRATENNPFFENVRKKKKVFAIVTVFLLLTIGLISVVYWKTYVVLNMVLTSMFIEAVSILLLLEKEEKDHEKIEC